MEAVVCGILDVIFDGKELRWQENQLLYRDNPLGEDKYQPIAFDSKARLYLDEGKVVFEYLPIHWDVNPNIFCKKLSKDDFKEIIETLSEVNFCDKAIKYVASRNLQFRQVVKIIAKSEQLAQTNKLTEITEEIIKGVIDEDELQELGLKV